MQAKKKGEEQSGSVPDNKCHVCGKTKDQHDDKRWCKPTTAAAKSKAAKAKAKAKAETEAKAKAEAEAKLEAEAAAATKVKQLG